MTLDNESGIRKKTTIRRHFRRVFLWLPVFLFNSLPAYSQADTGAIGERNQYDSGIREINVWAAPAEQKIRPDDPVEKTNLVWSDADNLIEISGAGNEKVPFQVVISTPVSGGRGTEAMEGFFVESSDFTSGEGTVIASENIRFYLQHYIMLYAESGPAGDTGYWPDALVPLRIPFSTQAHYHVVNNRPVWGNVAIPPDTPKGRYRGTITVTRNDDTLRELDVALDVYDFTLPDETGLITYINASKNWLAQFYNQSPESDETEKLTQIYYDFLYDNRMEPWFNDMLQPELSVRDGEVDVDFDRERYDYYMNELQTKRVLLNAYPGSLRSQIDAEPFSGEFTRIVQSYLSKVAAWFRKNGWQDRLVFNSPIDEPRSSEEYEDTRRWARLVNEAAGEVPFLATRTPVPVKEHPEWGTLRGHIDHFSIHGNHMNDPALKPVIREEQERGGEITWYVSCDQRYPQPNYFIDAPALDPVMIPWITEAYGMDGILYWAINFWSQTPNPWLDASTFHSGFLCSGGRVLNGEGSLVYPGDYAEQYTGQPNIEGPVSSIRFELLRRGIEDHVYLQMLKNLGDKAFAEQAVKNHVIDVRAFSRNLEQLYITRKKMARRIEELR